MARILQNINGNLDLCNKNHEILQTKRGKKNRITFAYNLLTQQHDLGPRDNNQPLNYVIARQWHEHYATGSYTVSYSTFFKFRTYRGFFYNVFQALRVLNLLDCFFKSSWLFDAF